jgi:hypothetical protein
MWLVGFGATYLVYIVSTWSGLGAPISKTAQLRGCLLPICTGACVPAKLCDKARFVSESTSSSMPSLQGFSVSKTAPPAQVTRAAAKAAPICGSKLFGAERLERSKAKTSQGYTRLANAILRDAIGLPLTCKQQDEIRMERPKLKPEQIDKNIYRSPQILERAPRDMPRRRRPGWVCRQFVLPRPIVEGLMFLAKAKAQAEFAERSNQPRGLRRRYRQSGRDVVPKRFGAFISIHLPDTYIFEVSGIDLRAPPCFEAVRLTGGAVKLRDTQ